MSDTSQRCTPPQPGIPTLDDPLIPISQATRLGYGSGFTLRTLINEGILPARRHRRVLKVLRSDLDKYVATPVVPGGGDDVE